MKIIKRVFKVLLLLIVAAVIGYFIYTAVHL